MTEYEGSLRVNINRKDPSKVAIIILNWNGWENTIECLESLYQIDYPTYEIILVDNGSKDDSVQKIENSFLRKPHIFVPITHFQGIAR